MLAENTRFAISDCMYGHGCYCACSVVLTKANSLMELLSYLQVLIAITF